MNAGSRKSDLHILINYYAVVTTRPLCATETGASGIKGIEHTQKSLIGRTTSSCDSNWLPVNTVWMKSWRSHQFRFHL